MCARTSDSLWADVMRAEEKTYGTLRAGTEVLQLPVQVEPADATNKKLTWKNRTPPAVAE